MYIHVRFGPLTETTVIEFDHNFMTAKDVMKMARKNYMKDTHIVILNEHGVEIMKNELVMKGRTYQIKRVASYT